MINKESPSLENINKPQNSHRVNFGKTIGAITLIGALTLGQVGCSEINALSPTSITETTEKPTGSSTEPTITTTPGSETVTVTIPTTKPTTEASTTIPTTKPTTEAPTTKPTTEAPTTIPTTKPTTEAPTPTTSELEGVAAERLQFTKDLLNLYDNSVKDSNSAFNKIKDFVTREQIIKYGKTGEGLNVLKGKDGSPIMAFINCPSKVINTFNSAVKEMEMYDKNYLSFLKDNGVRALMANKFDQNAGAGFHFNKEGLISWNADQSAIDRCITITFENNFLSEVFGIKAYNLGGDYSNYVGFIKQDLASMCWYNLYKKTKKDSFLSSARGNYVFAKTYYNDLYSPVGFKDQKIQNLINNIIKDNLMTSFGDSWSTIKENCNDRPDWNSFQD